MEIKLTLDLKKREVYENRKRLYIEQHALFYVHVMHRNTPHTHNNNNVLTLMDSFIVCWVYIIYKIHTEK